MTVNTAGGKEPSQSGHSFSGPQPILLWILMLRNRWPLLSRVVSRMARSWPGWKARLPVIREIEENLYSLYHDDRLNFGRVLALNMAGQSLSLIEVFRPGSGPAPSRLVLDCHWLGYTLFSGFCFRPGFSRRHREPRRGLGNSERWSIVEYPGIPQNVLSRGHACCVRDHAVSRSQRREPDGCRRRIK